VNGSDGDQDDAQAVRGGGQPFRRRRERQGRQGGPNELHGRHRDRVAAAQQAALGHGKGGPEQQGQDDEAIAEGRGAAAPAARDQDDAGQGHGEPDPRHGAGHGVLPERRDDRDQDRRGADQQRGVGDARPGDPGVLQDDRPAVPDRAGGQHERRTGGADPGARGRVAGGHAEQDRGGEPEARGRQPAWLQPLQGQLGQRNGGPPQQPGGNEGSDSAAAVGVHVSMNTGSPHRVWLSVSLAKYCFVLCLLNLMKLT
jgi:hypothetical protein